MKVSSVSAFLSVFFLVLFSCSTDSDSVDAQPDGDLEDDVIDHVDNDAEAAESDGDGELGDPEPDVERVWYEFPPDFLFGAATAGFQVDMGCPTLPDAQCVDAASDWYAYVTDADMLAHGRTYLSGDDPAVKGPGHWELFESDYDLAANDLHANTFRMSIEWSRVFPQSTEGVESYDDLKAIANADALDTYHAMFAAMRARGIEPFVTLHHYTLPLWMHDAVGCTLDPDACTDRGWLDPERIVPEIAKYAGFCAREFGAEVDLWATQNEPFAVLLSGYLQPSPTRSNPPAMMLNAEAGKTALLAMIEAHARMVDAVREGDTIDASGNGTNAEVGIVYAMAPVLPMNPDSELDRRAADHVFYLWNLLFLDAAALGLLDENLDGNSVERADLRDRMDFIGLNYKMSMQVEGLQDSLLPDLSPLLTLNPLTLLLELIQPRGLYEMAELLQTRYGKPVYITENNGQQLWKNDEVEETRYVVENLQWSLYAIGRGVDIRGYFYWAFMDNFEWNHGMTIDLGLYAVDADDPEKKRIPRSMVEPFGRMGETRSIPQSLQTAYPVDFEESATGGVPDWAGTPGGLGW